MNALIKQTDALELQFIRSDLKSAFIGAIMSDYVTNALTKQYPFPLEYPSVDSVYFILSPRVHTIMVETVRLQYLKRDLGAYSNDDENVEVSEYLNEHRESIETAAMEDVHNVLATYGMITMTDEHEILRSALQEVW